MDKVRIYAATQADRDTLRRLYYDFHEFHARGVPDHLRSLGPYENYDWAEFDRTLEGILTNPEATIMLLAIEGQPIGLVEVYVKQGDPANKAVVAHRYGHVQSLFVSAPLRHRGFGKQLMAAAETWAREKGATSVHLDTWEFDAGPLGFYEKNGYRTFRRALIKEL
jgi:ribosomal protein S18 acetylase RimI-like enzyme